MDAHIFTCHNLILLMYNNNNNYIFQWCCNNIYYLKNNKLKDSCYCCCYFCCHSCSSKTRSLTDKDHTILYCKIHDSSAEHMTFHWLPWSSITFWPYITILVMTFYGLVWASMTFYYLIWPSESSSSQTAVPIDRCSSYDGSVMHSKGLKGPQSHLQELKQGGHWPLQFQYLG